MIPPKPTLARHPIRSAIASLAAAILTTSLIQDAPAEIPVLHWEERSDWINVKTGLPRAAVGDGRADDTAALQAAFDGLHDGASLYFPPGTYRITAPLQLRNAAAARWIGGLLIGCGRDSILAWGGVAGQPMIRVDGVAYTRFVGISFDGSRKASAGLHYQATRGFQTEVTHRHLAFRGFTNAAILEDHAGNGQALAETTFENCLFQDCERGVAFLQFNDYDYTFDGCEFQRCGVAIDCAHGNFYVRNCHFAASRIVDIRDLSEHCSSVRRSTSVGSHTFVQRGSSVASLTIQDCHIEGWKNPDGAILLSRPPVLLFDCTFTHPPRRANGESCSPVRVHSQDQRLIVSENRVADGAELFQGGKPSLMVVPPGQRHGVVRSAERTFLQNVASIPKRIFDAKRDFGAKGNGEADDTEAIQQAIDAASREAGDAMAYLPTGTYLIKKTLRVRGNDYSVSGSGWSTKLVWRGAEGGTMMEVRDPQRITIADLMVGAHDGGAMNNGADIEQQSAGRASRISYDGVYVYGMYQKQPFRKGLRLTRLTEKDVVVLPHLQGNVRLTDCGRATVLANCTYEGSVVIEGKDQPKDGLLGFQTRLATLVTHGLYVRDNNSVVMSDFYVEQADNGYVFEGAPEDPPGRVTLTGAKFQSFTTSDRSKNTVADIRNYGGQIFIGPYQFYQEPKRMRFKQQGESQVQLYLWGSSWYGTAPDSQLSHTTQLFPVGNESYGSSPASDAALDRLFFNVVPTETTLAQLSRALDDLRRLGELDLRLNHP